MEMEKDTIKLVQHFIQIYFGKVPLKFPIFQYDDLWLDCRVYKTYLDFVGNEAKKKMDTILRSSK